ncbi:MAG: TolC family protein [Acidobacteria bacterium]|nr:TolC family protein [Acidobacteriota bacterium]
MSHLRCFLAAACGLLVAMPSAFAQQPQLDTKESWHSNFTRKYLPPEVAPVNFSNSPRLESLIRAGRIYLSLQDAIALALENNLDIELQRYGPRIAEAELLRARAGGVIRGIPQSVNFGPQSAINLQTGGGGAGVTGTGGGGGGGRAGGGGDIAASGAIISFTGTQIPNLDEFAFVAYNRGRRSIPLANSFTTGTAALRVDSNNVNFGVQKSFLTGSTVSVSYGGTGQSSNNARSEINPVTNANMNVEFSQRLLQGFGVAVNSRNIRIAKKEIQISDLVFKQQVMQTVASIVNLYSDMVSAMEDVKVRRQSLALNEKLYNDNKKQVEIGTLAPIEIVRAEAEVARSQQELTAAETQLLQQETIIKSFLSRTGVSSPTLADARIVPTDSLRIPDVEPVQPIQDLVAQAVRTRPELEQTQINLDIAKISYEGTRSALLPSLDLVAGYTTNGLAGQLNLRNPNLAQLQPGIIPPTVNGDFLGGPGTLVSQLFGGNFPDYSVGFRLNIPIRNRAAQSDAIRDALSIRQAEIRQRQQLNQVRVDVQNALIGLQQARARYQFAQKSRILQEQNLEAEQKKYALGVTTIFFVIQAQRDLAQAQAAEVAALTAYNRSRVSLELSTGQILSSHSVALDDARQGRVSRPPTPLPDVEPGRAAASPRGAGE